MHYYTYEGSSEQSRCDVVATDSSVLSPLDLPPLQLKVNLPLIQVEFDQMQADKRSQHRQEFFVDKDTLCPRAHDPSPWHSTLVQSRIAPNPSLKGHISGSPEQWSG